MESCKVKHEKKLTCESWTLQTSNSKEFSGVISISDHVFSYFVSLY